MGIEKFMETVEADTKEVLDWWKGLTLMEKKFAKHLYLRNRANERRE